MTEREDPAPDRRLGARVAAAVLPVAAVLAAAAVATVVLSDDVRWLRLGVVAALWAALVAVWAVVRRPAAEALRSTYELELAAEVDARQAHEMAVERDVRRELEAERGGEIDALRGEIGRLRSALEQRGTASPAYGTRLQVVGGSALPDRSGSDDRHPAAVADQRTTAIPAASRPAPGHAPVAPAAPSRGVGVNGRTVAELLAAHAEYGPLGGSGGGGATPIGGRRRRER